MSEAQKPGIFISHTGADAALANALGALVRKVFAGAITPWYSSDRSPRGGIKPGEPWWERIHSELSGAAQVFAVVTPRSTQRPWIYWECGIGCIACEGKVTPIAFRVDIPQLGPPLSYFEAIDGLDREGLSQGILKVGEAVDLSPDAEIVSGCVKDFVATAEASLEGVEEEPGAQTPDPVSVLYGPLQNMAERLQSFGPIGDRLDRIERLIRSTHQSTHSHRLSNVFTDALSGSEFARQSLAEQLRNGSLSPSAVSEGLADAGATTGLPRQDAADNADVLTGRIMHMAQQMPLRPDRKRDQD